MKWILPEIQKRIDDAIPPGSVVTAHNDQGHFYQVMTPDEDGNVGMVYRSVTDKLQVVKDESLITFKMNRSLDYVFQHWAEFSEQNVMEHLDKARRASVDIMEDAGDIGRDVHKYRENYFKDWIKNGKAPEDIINYIPPEQEDIRAVSALRALHQFCDDYHYQPIRTELFVYSHKMKLGGTLDDIGFTWMKDREGNSECQHELIESATRNFVNCVKCDFRYRIYLTLMDIKTSNQFKDHYFFQVALYKWMFYKLVGLRPQKCLIVKLSKVDGTYQVEDLKRPAMVASYARSMVRTNNGLQFIRELRKNNQKRVITI